MAARRKVLVAVDGSQSADDALRWYVEHLHKPHTDVILLFVAESFKMYSSHVLKTVLLVGDDEVNRFVQSREDNVKQLVDKYRAICSELGIEVNILIKEGKTPGQVVTEVAENENCHSIVMGCRGHGTVRRSVIGSVSNHVVHHATVPVVVHKTAEPRPRRWSRTTRPRTFTM